MMKIVEIINNGEITVTINRQGEKKLLDLHIEASDSMPEIIAGLKRLIEGMEKGFKFGQAAFKEDD